MKVLPRKYLLPALLLVLSLLLAALSSGLVPRSYYAATARKVQRVVNHRLKLLDSFSEKALRTPSGEWLSLVGLPEDMVVYRYENDTLQSWANRFSTVNDVLSSGAFFQSV